ncbi:hypothetical protein BS78_03G027100 [Paspalum vaginatum]|nr:hypothetical protein BS78_03G027100 [Paspalum vaginatum]
MSDKCANCDCADKSQCTKKSDSYGVVIVDTESRVERPAAESAGGENDGCNCGADCKCGSDCKCGK